MPSSSSQMITILFFVAIGFLVGAAMATWLAGRQKNNKKEELPAPLKPQKSTGLNLEIFEEVVSLCRRRADGQLVVAVGGKPVELVSELTETKRKQMEQTVREFLVWLGLLPAKTAKPQPTAAQPVARAEAVQSPAVRVVPAAGAVEKSPAGAVPGEVKKAGSIVQQINDILQENLRTSGMINRGVSLAEDPKLGVIVYIGLQRHVGIDSVPDAEIKAMIKAAVQEWEHRTETGE